MRPIFKIRACEEELISRYRMVIKDLNDEQLEELLNKLERNSYLPSISIDAEIDDIRSRFQGGVL